MVGPLFKTLTMAVERGIARIAFDNPPMNLLDEAMFADLDRLGCWLEQQQAIGVAIFESADPDFFIAHAHLSMLADMPFPHPDEITGPSSHQQIVERFRTLPQLTIGKLRGVARGGGSEFLLALDLRYGATERAVLGQPEIALGFPPGCGATQRLTRLIGRSAAIEVIVGGLDYSAEEAARIGWLTRAVPDAELDEFVEQLAVTVASRSPYAIALAKRAIDAATGTLDDGLSIELAAFLDAFGTEQAQSRVRQAMASGFQTRSLETGSLDEWGLALGDISSKETD